MKDEGVADFRRALLAHFDRTRRALPWRVGRNPYRVMVSEFMLQQTRVKTVVPYYERWMRKFPDWDALAGATEDDVILEWKGLGYYSRARNLHHTARAVRERFGGHLPPDPAALKTLPGVGDYTAGAVASIAFGHVVPAVDGNVRRVLARLLDIAAPGPAQLRREAARLVDPTRPGDFNEAMMELGATLCTPRAPRCGECPVAQWCRARVAGTVEERPAPKRRRPVPRVEYVTAVLVDPAGRTFLVRRPPRGLLAGMWEFPAVDQVPPGPAHPLPPVRHAFTHLRATYRPIILPTESPARWDDRPSTWVHYTRLDEWALPVAQQKIGALLRRWLEVQPRQTADGA